MTRKDGPFFVGYLPVPKGLRWFLRGLAAGLVALAVALGYWIGTGQDDPGDGAFRFDYGPQTVAGVIELTPLPILHVTSGTDRIPAGHTLMLAGPGKNGVFDRAEVREGQSVEATGIILQRGTLDMLQVGGEPGALRMLDTAATVPPAEDLGRWRLAGEICDGKCLSGAMRPGRGLSHKACANLCLLGGVPPVFVSSQPVEGSEFLLIAGAEGAEPSDALLDEVGRYISVSGRIARHGDLLVFAMEPETIEVLP